MADALLSERLQPSLLDRLTDDAPGETGETRKDRVVDVAQLRRIVLRDLLWLLNTTRYESLKNLEDYPLISRSTINFGVPDFAGGSMSKARAVALQKDLREAIMTFEPRLLPETLEVRLAGESTGGQHQLFFDIRGDLWAQPLPIELYMRTQLDTTTGDMRVQGGR